MPDVSTRALLPFLDAVAASGVDVAAALAGSELTRDALHDPGARLPWPAFCELMERVERACGGRDALVAAARHWVEVPSFEPLARLMQLVAEPYSLLRLVQRWIGPMLFSPVESELERLGERDARMTLTIPEDHRDCPAFFAITAETLIQMPRMLGLPDAEVAVVVAPRRATYAIRLPRSRSLLARLREALPRSRRTQVLVDELRAYGDQLHQRMVELAAARQTAEEALRHKESFLAKMSHELRTPLNAILGMATLLEHDRLGAEQREHVAVIRDSADTLLGMVDDLLDRPRDPAPEAPIPLASRRPEPAPAGPALRVLVAEDNHVNQRVTRRMLERLGHQVCCVDDGAAALARAQAEPFDLVLMDVSMPVMDGIEATAAIRRLGGLPAMVPIVAVTAHATDDVRARCLAAGMNDYLTKPVRMATLAEAVVRNACAVRDSA